MGCDFWVFALLNLVPMCWEFRVMCDEIENLFV